VLTGVRLPVQVPVAVIVRSPLELAAPVTTGATVLIGPPIPRRRMAPAVLSAYQMLPSGPRTMLAELLVPGRADG